MLEYPSPETADLNEIDSRRSFFQRVVRSAINGVYVYDVVLQRNIYVSPRYTAITGFTLAEINAMGADFLNLFHPEDVDAVLGHMAEVIDTSHDEVIPIEYRFRHKAGDWIWLLSHDVAFERGPDGSVRRFLGSFIDITAQKEVQASLAHFTHIAAHDLREPSRRICLAAELLTQVLGDDVSPQAQRLIDTLQMESQRSLDLITAFRHLTTIGGEAPRLELVDLSALLANVATEFDAPISFDELPEVMACRPFLLSLYRNLLQNAVTYGDPESVRCTAERRGAHWVLGVRNEGSTVPESERASLFQPFRRGTATGDGSGLGLAICKRVVEYHRGRIWVDSGENFTHFQFMLSDD